MEGDSRNPRVSLLKKYDIPIDHLSYEYIESCKDKKELERIIRILRSGQEGIYPDLLKTAENQLRQISPDSRVLRLETPALTKEAFTNEEWKILEDEILSWEEEMTVIDKGLEFEKQRFDTVGNKNLPEVRKIIQKENDRNKKKAETNKIKIETNIKNERIKSGDYAAWDKFDVDKELLKLDLEEERTQEKNAKLKREIEKKEKKEKTEEKKIEPINIDPDSYSNTEQQIIANQAKDRGNESFKTGDYSTALKYYNLSLKLCPTVNAYNNRAMTYIKLQNYQEALGDCNEVLKREQNNIKALHRRATAYQNLGGDNNNELALKDLLKIISLEPTNRVAQSDLQALKKKLNIQDVGKKFRMFIEESGNDHVKDFLSKSADKSAWNDSDNLAAVRKLPLTYYGPSTSTFQCEPQSMSHRMLSGPTLFGEVMCKCNGNATRQNPLCHRCGEKLSRPRKKRKPVAKPEVDAAAEKTESKDQANAVPTQGDNEVKSKTALNEENEKSKLAASEGGNGDNEIVQKMDQKIDELQNVMTELKISDQKVDKISDIEVKAAESEIEKLDLSVKERKNIDNEQFKELGVDGGTMQRNKEETFVLNNQNSVKDNQCLPCASSQSEIKTKTKKKRSRKKKSKEPGEQEGLHSRMYSEPAMIVQATKYLKPTSAEPKPEIDDAKESQKNNSETMIQFKSFVQNKKSPGTGSGVLKTTTASSNFEDRNFKVYTENSIDRIARNYEGNKENILESNYKDYDIDGTPSLKSSFEFMKSWEAMKKSDESYEKRAEIIRLMQPEDLKAVIGNNLDPDMLKSLLECLEKHILDSDPKKVTGILKELPQIPRFGLVNLFLSPNERRVLDRLIESTERKGFALDEESKNSLRVPF
ncbi:UNVERIFIED_CONTAM: hypothetical protein PYX00_008330 [Menopon gallinae]|uniref:RNA-polymerase II-associated protein 3-like C-terminal domain-containing protein n=1 Tax=Menopon gallinae TaxID=328185 RepID=A0AAW2HNA4_9NEOP